MGRKRQRLAYLRGKLLERREQLRARVEAEMRAQGSRGAAEPADEMDLAFDYSEEEICVVTGYKGACWWGPFGPFYRRG